jgi:hydrogenase nickel incorporation protein HypB
MVQAGLEGWNLADLDFLFIENVGNLACPSAYDLGEDVRLVLQSVTEGDDKPLKYPTLFHSGDVAILTKMDLAAAVELDWEGATQNIESVRPGMAILSVSAKPGRGMGEYRAFVRKRRVCLVSCSRGSCEGRSAGLE